MAKYSIVQIDTSTGFSGEGISVYLQSNKSIQEHSVRTLTDDQLEKLSVKIKNNFKDVYIHVYVWYEPMNEYVKIACLNVYDNFDNLNFNPEIIYHLLDAKMTMRHLTKAVSSMHSSYSVIFKYPKLKKVLEKYQAELPGGIHSKLKITW